MKDWIFLGEELIDFLGCKISLYDGGIFKDCMKFNIENGINGFDKTYNFFNIILKKSMINYFL